MMKIRIERVSRGESCTIEIEKPQAYQVLSIAFEMLLPQLDDHHREAALLVYWVACSPYLRFRDEDDPPGVHEAFDKLRAAAACILRICDDDTVCDEDAGN